MRRTPFIYLRVMPFIVKFRYHDPWMADAYFKTGMNKPTTFGIVFTAVKSRTDGHGFHMYAQLA